MCNKKIIWYGGRIGINKNKNNKNNKKKINNKICIHHFDILILFLS